MAEKASCLVQKLTHYVALDEMDRAHLARLEKSERVYGQGSEVYQGGDRNTEMFVVKRGWLYSYTDLLDGRRQIVKLHHPGDVIGFPEIALKHMATTLRAAEATCLCPFPKSALDVILCEAPKVSALLIAIGMRDQVTLIDLLRAMGRMSAIERLAYMLLDVIARLRITNQKMTDSFRLPMTQSQIADYLGLTNIYVSKTFRKMCDAGYVKRDGKTVQILREADLIEMTDFHDRYADMDTSWFPDR